MLVDRAVASEPICDSNANSSRAAHDECDLTLQCKLILLMVCSQIKPIIDKKLTISPPFKLGS